VLQREPMATAPNAFGQPDQNATMVTAATTARTSDVLASRAGCFVLLKLQVPDRTAAALKAREAGLGTERP
jgi:hypothetical protein